MSLLFYIIKTNNSYLIHVLKINKAKRSSFKKKTKCWHIHIFKQIKYTNTNQSDLSIFFSPEHCWRITKTRGYLFILRKKKEKRARLKWSILDFTFWREKRKWKFFWIRASKEISAISSFRSGEWIRHIEVCSLYMYATIKPWIELYGVVNDVFRNFRRFDRISTRLIIELGVTLA